ncbi:MAG: S8 family serine peptidase [Thermoplasmata archaeon]
MGEVKDDGIDQNHPDFDGRLIGTVGSPPDAAHGTCAFGVVFSSGENDPVAKGMLPGGEGVFCDWGISRYGSINDLKNIWGGVFQSNSWSQGNLTSNYTSFSRENDWAVADFDIVMLYSVGNSGNGVAPKTSSEDSVAKNVIGVGALYHYNNPFRIDDNWTDNGPNSTPSQGPASDGRVKPDLTGPFDEVYTTDSVDGDGVNGYAAGNYTNFGGTSAATPVVAGAVGLVYQMYKENHFGNNPSGELPHASTVKAILIADAFQYDFSEANRYQQGWGGVDVGAVYFIGENHFIVDESTSLGSSQSTNYLIAPTGSVPLKISLVWTDVPASPGANPALVNNLDLKVTAPDGTVYWGNLGLGTSKWSSSGGSADNVNNVENVFIENPISGTWTLEVIGKNIPFPNQAFALVASNAVEGLRVNITYPSPGKLLNGIITVTGTSSPDITRVEVKIDNGFWENATGTTDWTYDWNSSLYPDGDHTTYVRGFNGTIYSNVESVGVSTDNDPPISSIAVGLPNYFNGSTWFVVPLSQFTISADDNSSGVNFTQYRILFEGNPVGGWINGNLFTLSWGEGNYSIQYYSMDNLSNAENIKTIAAYVDLSPPITDIGIGLPKYRYNASNDHWNVTTATTFNISILEEKSLVDFTWYTIDGAFFKGSSFDLKTYSDGLHNITWGAEDHFGNNETGNSITIFLDPRPPIISLNIGEPKSRKYPFNAWNVTTSTPFTLNSTDNYSGINFTWYLIDEDYFEGVNFTLDGYDDGLHNITIGAQDNVGNNKTELTLKIYLDSAPPITELEIGEPQYLHSSNGNLYVIKTTSFKLFASDNYTEVVTTWYTINGTYHEGTEFNLASLSEGIYMITWGSIDNLTQNETGNSITVWLDDSAPKTNLTIGLPRYPTTPNDGCNVTFTTQFTLSEVDYPDIYSAGINYTWYAIDNDYYVWTPFNLSGYEEGWHVIKWGSRDNLGNNETANIMRVYLNTILPTTLEIEGKKYRNSTEDYWYVTDETNFTLAPANIHAGIKYTWYSIDGNCFEGTFFTLSGYDEGVHTFTWGSEDNLGYNETGNSLTVILDNNPPETSLEIGNPKYRADTEEKWAVTGATVFTFTSSDNYSGVSDVWYRIDNIYFKGSSFTFSGYTDGLHTIAWGSEDFLGHNETERVLSIYLDNTPPTISIHIGQPKRSFDDFVRINSSTPITLTLEDSGVNKSLVYYSLDGGIINNNYESPFTVPSRTMNVIYGGEDVLGNKATESILHVLVDNSDTDGDGIDDLADDDDDNDGLPDIEEDLNENGIIDSGETNPLNPDSDGDGHWDGVDAYPLDRDRWDGEGESLNILPGISVIIAIVLVLLFIIILKQKKNRKEKVLWTEEETEFESHEKQVEWGEEGETMFEPHDEQVEWREQEETMFEPHDEQVEWKEEETSFEPHDEQVEWREQETTFEPLEKPVEKEEGEKKKAKPLEKQVEWEDEEG